MNGVKQWKAIFKKEMLELYRDKIAVLFLILPIIAFPIVSVAMSFVGNEKVSEIKYAVVYKTESDKTILANTLSKNAKYKFSQVDYIENENQLANGKIDFLITIDNENVDFIYLSSSFRSVSLATEIGDFVDKNYNAILTDSEKNGISVSLKDESGQNLSADSMVSIMIVPIMLIMMIFQSTTSLANNSFAGEKERKTLEMLLLSGVKRKYILFGKSTALMLVSVTNSAVCVGSCMLTYILNGSINNFKFMQSDKRYLSIVLLVLITLLMSAISVLISMTVSLVTSNVKNAQLINEILVSVPVLVAALVSFGIIKLKSIAVGFVPIINIIVSLMDVFYGEVLPLQLTISFIETVLLILLILMFDNYYINREKLLK